MDKKTYQKIVKKYTPKENRLKNALSAFLYGGIFGVLFQALAFIVRKLFNLTILDATTWMLILVIFISCLLTSIGKFDKLVTIFKSALIIPISGFAHSICSSCLDYKNDGLVTGIGANCFKLAGSVILYGIISSFILVLIGVFISG